MNSHYEHWRVRYDELNARQKESYNFAKVSAVLADYGFVTTRLNDDWHGADFVAQRIDGITLRVQLKGRLAFSKKYQGKDLYVAFPADGLWYLYPHDDLLAHVLNETNIIANTRSWTEDGEYHFPYLSELLRRLLASYEIGGT